MNTRSRTLQRSICWIGLALTSMIAGCGGGEVVEDPGEMKMLVIGMDGLDPKLLGRLMNEGRMPNFSKLAAQGSFKPLATSMPPHSPVAWSNVISGATPGTHQIFDFIHRDAHPTEDRKEIHPYLSTSKVVETEAPWFLPESLPWGSNWHMPTTGSKTEQLRRGPAFWDSLVASGVDTTIYRIPANYPPPVEVEGLGEFRCICGMGTPDLGGTYGVFTGFWERLTKEKEFGGGRYIRLKVKDHHGTAILTGPENYFREPPIDKKTGKPGKGKPPEMEIQVEIVRDPSKNTARVTIGETTVLLNQGEWSEWIPVEFKTEIPGSLLVGLAFPTSMHAMVRLFMKQVHPTMQLYMSPMNIDPRNPINPISTPPEFAAEIAEACGPFYTTGIPEDTKALRSKKPNALNEDDFLQMVHVLAEERTRQYHHALAEFKQGFLFFYFGHTDQLSHIFWRDTDPDHPGRLPEQDGKYDKVIENVYLEMDERLAEAMAIIDDNDTLMVISDHGFGSFRRGFNVNTWLLNEGYLEIKSDGRAARALFTNFDFFETRAYAVGLSSLYINLEGREKNGIVPPDQKRALMEEIAAKLIEVRDDDGTRVIEKVYIVEDYYPGADPAIAPDMILGYNHNYRTSWATGLGGQPEELLVDNKDRWSGDHFLAHYLVPGSVVSNRPIALDEPALYDVAPTILKSFGIEPPKEMIGRNMFAAPGNRTAGVKN